MGYVSYLALYGVTREQVAAAALNQEAAISPTVSGFTLFVNLEFGGFAEARSLAIVLGLARALRCPSLFVRVDGERLSFSLIEWGSVIDQYTSPTAEAPSRWQAGNSERLCAVFDRAGAREDVERILASRDGRMSPEARHLELIVALGMPRFAAEFNAWIVLGDCPSGLTEADLLLTGAAQEGLDAQRRWSTHSHARLNAYSRIEDEISPSGREVRRTIDPGGQLIQQLEFYRDGEGGTAIGVSMRFGNTRKIGESYIEGGHIVSRATYEAARVPYADMPMADFAVRDLGSEGVELVALRQSVLHELGRQGLELRNVIDLFCQKLMACGRSADVNEWMRSGRHCLGRLSSAMSDILVGELVERGAAEIHVCSIYSSVGGLHTSGRVVVALPPESTQRARLLRLIRPFATQFGVEDTLDYGQQYAYLLVE